MIVSSARTRVWLTAEVDMVIVFSVVGAVGVPSTDGIDLFGVEDIPPVASAASISRSRCSNKAFFFRSVFRSVGKFIENLYFLSLLNFKIFYEPSLN